MKPSFPLPISGNRNKTDRHEQKSPLQNDRLGDGRLREHARWNFGVSRGAISKRARSQYIIHRITPVEVAKPVLANSSNSPTNIGNGAVTKAFS
jgi:hypothetical protein